MSIPGFTAEASLSRTAEGYRVSTAFVIQSDRGSVVPQWCWTDSAGTTCCVTPWFGVQCHKLLTIM